MANVSVLPFGGALSLEVAYVAGINLVPNVYTAECMVSFARFLLHPTIVSIIHGLAELETQWFDKHNALANDSSSPVAQRNAHQEKAERSRTRLQAMETLAAAPGELYQVSQGAIALLGVDGTLDTTARLTDRAEEGMDRARTSLANAFKSESVLMTVLQRMDDITVEQKRLGRQISDRLTRKSLCGSIEMKKKLGSSCLLTRTAPSSVAVWKARQRRSW